MVIGSAILHSRVDERGIRSCPVNHVDLLEDVVLGMVVAWTTVAALYVGWRAGRLPIRRLPFDNGGDTPGRDVVEPDNDAHAVGVVPAADWSRRLSVEHARSARHGSSATVVAIRTGQPGRRDRQRGESATDVGAVATVALARRSRASDTVCLTHDGTIRILLIETTEAGARRFVDRITPELAAEPDAGGDIVAAWAAIAPGRDLRAADRLADARLRGATSGWLRSLAVRRTTAVTLEGAGLDGPDLDGGSTDPSGSTR